MKEYQELSIEEEMEREVEEIQRRLDADDGSESYEVTPEMDQAFWERVRAYEENKALEEDAEAGEGTENSPVNADKTESAEEIENAEEISEGTCKIENIEGMSGNTGGKIRRIPRRSKVWIALVAVLVLVFAFGATSIGSKSYFKELWDKMIGREALVVTNVEDMDAKDAVGTEELAVYKEIADKLGIGEVTFGYTPEAMTIDRVEIDEEQRLAKIFYSYEGEVIKYAIYANETDSSFSRKLEDVLVAEFIVKNTQQEIVVEEYQIDDKKNDRYEATFEYKGTNYQLKGVMKKREIEKILKNLKYF